MKEEPKKEPILNNEVIGLEESFCSAHCDGHCCYSYVVLINSEDAIRIAKNMPDISPLDYLTFYDAQYGKEESHPVVRINGFDSVLGIKYVETDDEETWPCVFLDLEKGLCTIHTFNPMVCAAYPFSMDADDNIGHLENVLCPEEWNAQDEEAVRKIVRQSWQDSRVYKEKAEKWNQKYGTKSKSFS